jgi:hypothetical protein
MELFAISLMTLALAVLAVLANEVGVDSRDESDDKHRPNYPVGIS